VLDIPERTIAVKRHYIAQWQEMRCNLSTISRISVLFRRFLDNHLSASRRKLSYQKLSYSTDKFIHVQVLGKN